MRKDDRELKTDWYYFISRRGIYDIPVMTDIFIWGWYLRNVTFLSELFTTKNPVNCHKKGTASAQARFGFQALHNKSFIYFWAVSLPYYTFYIYIMQTQIKIYDTLQV